MPLHPLNILPWYAFHYPLQELESIFGESIFVYRLSLGRRLLSFVFRCRLLSFIFSSSVLALTFTLAFAFGVKYRPRTRARATSVPANPFSSSRASSVSLHSFLVFGSLDPGCAQDIFSMWKFSLGPLASCRKIPANLGAWSIPSAAGSIAAFFLILGRSCAVPFADVASTTFTLRPGPGWP